jgi:iron complex outermembrane receptor protein
MGLDLQALGSWEKCVQPKSCSGLAWLCVFSLGLSLSAFAQEATPTAAEPNDSPAIEEIVVTITKRDEAVQDVGGSIAAFNEESIQNANIENVGDLIGLLPNVQVKSEDTDLSIRGVARAAFDSQSPVAYHINGVYQFNSLTYVGQFYDLQNVAVALGPSGTLYGRNANGGAIDLQWRKPENRWGASGDVTWAPRFDNYQVRSALNIPLSGVDNDLLNARFVFTREVGDGTTRNRAGTGREGFGAKNDWYTRLTLRSEPADNFSVELRGWYLKSTDRYAGGVSLLPAGQRPLGVLPFGLAGSFPYDWANGLTLFQQAFNGFLTAIGAPGAPYPAPVLQFILLNGAGALPPLVRDPEFFTPVPLSQFDGSRRHVHSALHELGDGKLETWEVDGTIEWNLEALPLLGDVDVFLMGGYGSIDNEGLSDSDATSYGALDTESGQHPETKRTFEIRFQSNNESWLNWTVGFFYVKNEIDQIRDTLTPLTISGASLQQVDEGYAPFANVTLKPIDPVEIFLGVRWNHDEFSRSEDPNPTPFDPIAAPFLDLEETFRETTLDAGLKYFITEDLLAYVKWARGYKAGFTQVLPATANPNFVPPETPTNPQFFAARAQRVKPEVILATEWGFKSSWLDGRLNANIAGFYYDYTNLQVPVIQFTQILNINADEATVWGAELSIDAVPIDGWVNRVAIGWLKAEFDEACANDPLVNLTLAPPPPDPRCAAKQVGLNAQDRNLVGNQDLKGRRLEDSPEWKISLLSSYAFELGSFGTLTPTLEFTWTDDSFRRPFNSAVDHVDSYTKTDVRVRWEEPQSRYWVEAFGENLEDNYVYPRGIVVALTGTAQGFGLLQPRTYGLRLGFDWGGGN